MICKLNKFFRFSMLLIIFSSASLFADGYGKTEKVFNFEDNEWNGIFYDNEDFEFIASIPNFIDVTERNDGPSFIGRTEDYDLYAIFLFQDLDLSSLSLASIIKVFETTFPDHQIDFVEDKLPGSRFSLDFTPINLEEELFMRVIFTDKGFISMSTADDNANRRIKFFNSIEIGQNLDEQLEELFSSADKAQKLFTIDGSKVGVIFNPSGASLEIGYMTVEDSVVFVSNKAIPENVSSQIMAKIPAGYTHSTVCIGSLNGRSIFEVLGFE